MITKVLVTAGIAVAAGLGVAAPAFADPASFGDLSCECHDPIPQGPIVQFFTPPAGQIAAGIQQGFSDTGPDVNGVPHN
ncbi:hypothetical protein PT015_18555 [Candidatus Mycobacterium wuenschmannii]|uniref:Uncharacterized protein n=1 Tax=Candidatus Mycobacterium wuenschmannii TaxID=3027808 RepID=A0ABY8VTB9_9MYCO|nr:hypothetical protein [Candidatus Mycobacterium wuenschmannii]WIM86865.1 hypothetical protein PT015_18555 [Candidatus Mycobacterium wuenschmannii]